MQSQIRKKEAFKVVVSVVLLLTVLFGSGTTASALTIYKSDGVYHEEGYIFVGESHSVIASHAVGFETVGNGGVWDYGGTIPVIYGYIWDGSRSVTQDGSPNTFTMMGNLFFVFEGNDNEEEIFVQMSKNYTHTSHTKIRHTTRNYATLGIWKRFFQFSGSLLIKRDTSSAIWHSDAL